MQTQETTLLIQTQGSMTMALPVDEGLCTNLINLFNNGQSMRESINVGRAFAVDVYEPSIRDIRKYRVVPSEELQEPTRQVLANLYYTPKTQTIGMVLMESKSGKKERICNTIGLSKADLYDIMSRVLRSNEVAERDMRYAERGLKDRRKGKRGRESRQRQGQIKQQLNNRQQQEQATEPEHVEAGV